VTRESLRILLEPHAPADAKEAANRGAMLGFLARLPAPFSARQEAAHFTASASSSSRTARSSR
jgi:hypothetical protein